MGTSKTNKKNICPPCTPIWPVILLTVMGVLVIGVSTWQWWGKGFIREKIVQEECPENTQLERLQAKAPLAVAKSGSNFTFTTPNGLKIDLPQNTAGELAYEIEASYEIKRTGSAADAHEIESYSAMMLHTPTQIDGQIVVTPMLNFALSFVDIGESEENDDFVIVQYLGQTKGGQSILEVVSSDENEKEEYPLNTLFVSSLKKKDLEGADYSVKKSELAGSRFIEPTDGSGSVWSLRSMVASDGMNEAEYAEALKIMKSLR